LQVNAPVRPGLEAIAHTLAYDALITGDSSLPEELIGSVVTPTLGVAGDASPPFLQTPLVRLRTLSRTEGIARSPGRRTTSSPR
jgi:hypothetical protein